MLTTLGISASDTLEGVSGSLLGMVLKKDAPIGCPSQTALLVVDGRKVCVDLFEASTGTACPNHDPQTLQDTEKNISTNGCTPISEKDATPWRFISLSQAQRACAGAGKRLLTNEEWYRAALGTPATDITCNMYDNNATDPKKTEENSCKSGIGTYDMVGNVWEWVDGSVLNGTYQGREMPTSGYVAGVDADGVALQTSTTEDELYGKDYVLSSKESTRGMIRGGFYGSGKDGGLYALNASLDLGFGSAGVGFRCVREYPL